MRLQGEQNHWITHEDWYTIKPVFSARAKSIMEHEGDNYANHKYLVIIPIIMKIKISKQVIKERIKTIQTTALLKSARVLEMWEYLPLHRLLQRTLEKTDIWFDLVSLFNGISKFMSGLMPIPIL